MKSIVLPADTEHVQFGDLADLVADALWPDAGPDDDRMTYACARINLDSELPRAVDSGALPVKDPLTLGPHTYPFGNALKTARVTVCDLRKFLAGRLDVEVSPEPQQTALATDAAKPAPEVELDYSLLATPTELLDAFEKWGLRAAWFAELDSHKWLLEAQRKKGQGQRGNVIQPLFCPFAVINGLIGKVRKANRLQPDTAWRTLEHKFPKVHATFESHDPRERTGD